MRARARDRAGAGVALHGGFVSHPAQSANRCTAGLLLKAHQETHQQVAQPYPCWRARERVAEAREQRTGLGRKALTCLMIAGQHPLLELCVCVTASETEGTGPVPQGAGLSGRWLGCGSPALLVGLSWIGRRSSSRARLMAASLVSCSH